MSTQPSDLTLEWVYPKEDKEWRKEIEQEFKIHPVTAQVLVSRGFTTLEAIHDFLYAQLPSLHDPRLLMQMDKAVERVITALSNGEGILVYGDNDVDGISGTTLLTEFLRELGGDAFFYLTNRSITRDALIVESIPFAKEKGCSVMITVDCGVTAANEIAAVIREGIDVIVTDHHEMGETVPAYHAMINPKQPGCTYPNTDITGVGVAFKLAHGITNELVARKIIEPKAIDLKNYLDLVTLGTISDMGALHGENRIFVRYGLKELALRKRVGLAKLLDVCDLGSGSLSTADIASKVAPRLNSLGRIDEPRKGVELLLLRDVRKAEAMATELDLNNIERQKIERTASEDTERSLGEHPEILNNRAIVLHSDQWHPGVIAIVATRLSKLYHRPTAIIAVENGIGKGSVRSIPGFSLMDALGQCSDLLMNFGGHDVASGLTIKEENIPEFRKRFVEFANGVLSPEDVQPKLYLDAQVDFSELTFEFLESLRLLEPHGNENPMPILYCEATQAWPPKEIGTNHLKLYLEQKDRMLEGIGFGMGYRCKVLKRKDIKLKVAFTPQVNNFQNKASIQLLLRDFKVEDES